MIFPSLVFQLSVSKAVEKTQAPTWWVVVQGMRRGKSGVPACSDPSGKGWWSPQLAPGLWHISLDTGQTEPGHCSGGSHRQLSLCPTITPPVWPCLYLTVQQQVLVWTACLLGGRNDEQRCFPVRKPCNILNDQNKVTFSTGSLHIVLQPMGGQLDAAQCEAPSA